MFMFPNTGNTVNMAAGMVTICTITTGMKIEATMAMVTDMVMTRTS